MEMGLHLGTSISRQVRIFCEAVRFRSRSRNAGYGLQGTGGTLHDSIIEISYQQRAAFPIFRGCI